MLRKSPQTTYLIASGFALAVVAAALVGGAERPPTPAAPAAGASTRPSPPSVPDLLRQLSDADWHRRDAAERQLLLIGEAVRPDLERLLKSNPAPETAQRLQAMLASLEETRRFGPTPVTLHLRGVKPAEAMAELAKQANVRFLEQPGVLWPANTDKRVTLDCDGETFWSVLGTFCSQAGVRFAGFGTESNDQGEVIRRLVSLAATRGKEPPAPRAVAGPFLLTVSRVDRTRVQDFEAPGQPVGYEYGCRLYLYAWSEPKIRQAHCALDRLGEVETDEGPVKPKEEHFGRDDILLNAGPNEVSLGPIPTGKKIARVRMNATFTVEAGTEKWQVDNFLRSAPTEKVIHGFKFTLKDIKKTGDDKYTFTVQAGPGTHSSAEFMAYEKLLDLRQPALLDARGQYPDVSSAGGRSESDAFIRTYEVTCGRNANNPKAGAPARFVWEVPAEIKTLTYPIEFTNIPLP